MPLSVRQSSFDYGSQHMMLPRQMSLDEFVIQPASITSNLSSSDPAIPFLYRSENQKVEENYSARQFHIFQQSSTFQVTNISNFKVLKRSVPQSAASEHHTANSSRNMKYFQQMPETVNYFYI